MINILVFSDENHKFPTSIEYEQFSAFWYNMGSNEFIIYKVYCQNGCGTYARSICYEKNIKLDFLLYLYADNDKYTCEQLLINRILL